MTSTPLLAAFDLDGTLLNAESQVSPYTLATLNELAEPDRHFVVATGRGFTSASQRLAGSHPIRWMICSNGAALYDRETGEAVAYDTIDADLLATSIAELRRHVPDVAISWESLNSGYAWTSEFVSIFGSPPPNRVVVDSSTPPPPDALKLLLAHPRQSVDELTEVMNEILATELAVTTSGLSFVEITAPGIDKSARLAQLCERLGVDRHDTIAFGDGMNDHGMLQWVGTGYAMANAHPGVVEAADRMTERANDEDGVAHTLRTIFS